VYLRLSREAVGEDYASDHPFAIGTGIVVREGADVAIVATGTMVAVARAAARELAEEDIHARVIDMHTIKPLDVDLIARAAEETRALVTVEEHSVVGGLGGAVCEAVAAHCPVPVRRVGIPDRFGESGAYPDILARAGLDAAHVAAAARDALRAKERPTNRRRDAPAV
jgi:transketolase